MNNSSNRRLRAGPVIRRRAGNGPGHRDPSEHRRDQIGDTLRHQLDVAWAQDDARRERFAAVHSEADLVTLQGELRLKVLDLIGGLPAERTPLNARVVGTIAGDGYRIEKVVFESVPGFHVTALLYVPAMRLLVEPYRRLIGERFPRLAIE